MEASNFIASWLKVMIVSVILIGLVELFYAVSIPFLYSMERGHWVVGGEYPAHIHFEVMVLSFVPAAVEFLCFGFIFKRFGERMIEGISAMGRLANGLLGCLSILAAKLIPYYLLTYVGANVWLLPLTPQRSLSIVSYLYLLFLGGGFLLLLIFVALASTLGLERVSKN